MKVINIRDNGFDTAIARADETIRGHMGTSATITSGEQPGAVIRGVLMTLKISAMPDRACALKAPARPCLSGLMMCGNCGVETR